MRRAIESGTQLRGITFGCVPVTRDESTRAHLNDLCESLHATLGPPVRPHRAPSPAALASAFQSGRVHLAWTSPTLVALDPRMREALPLVSSVRAGTATYFGVLFSARDRGPRSIDQLRGARVAWVARSSASGYLYPRMGLTNTGVSLDGLFQEELVLGSHGAVVDAVRAGRADVGATFAAFVDGNPEQPLAEAGFGADDAGAWHILQVSRPIPSDIVVASPALLRTLRCDLVDVLTHLHETPKAREAMAHVLNAESFDPCDPRLLAPLRQQFAAMEASATG